MDNNRPPSGPRSPSRPGGFGGGKPPGGGSGRPSGGFGGGRPAGPGGSRPAGPGGARPAGPGGSRPSFGSGPRPGGFGGPRPFGSSGPGGARPPFDRDKNFRKGPRKEEIARINHLIKVEQVRVIDDSGEMLGVMTVDEGVRIAKERGVDLVEISPNANPPVCKVMDYGKYKYEHQKKQAEARKKQKAVVIKEIKLRPTTDTHDVEIKQKAIARFLEEGDKVKISIKFRGREMAHPEIAREMMQGIANHFGDKIKLELSPKMEGRQMIMIMAPAK